MPAAVPRRRPIAMTSAETAAGAPGRDIRTPEGMRLIDLRHLGRRRVIGCWQVGDVLVDPGPATCSGALRRQLTEPPAAILLTHIHLDHAGATGSLVRRWPGVKVFVHERGARHLADPSRLVASAARLYGDDMDRLWGEVLPVPEASIRPLRGGETIPGGFTCADTPGHASHHLAYLHRDTGWAFSGDVAGVRIAPASHVLVPTPPPEIDVGAWRRSLRTLAAWGPSALAPTHFGAFCDVDSHLAAAERALAVATARASVLSAREFGDAVSSDVHEAGGAQTAAAYAQAAPLDHHYLGLRRHLAPDAANSERTA
jgi:glyoxylase-like metal-dependent hydrolase (beta-lactamase superfamily II)